MPRILFIVFVFICILFLVISLACCFLSCPLRLYWVNYVGVGWLFVGICGLFG